MLTMTGLIQRTRDAETIASGGFPKLGRNTKLTGSMRRAFVSIVNCSSPRHGRHLWRRTVGWALRCQRITFLISSLKSSFETLDRYAQLSTHELITLLDGSVA
jgi:hypothetical protein